MLTPSFAPLYGMCGFRSVAHVRTAVYGLATPDHGPDACGIGGYQGRLVSSDLLASLCVHFVEECAEDATSRPGISSVQRARSRMEFHD